MGFMETTQRRFDEIDARFVKADARFVKIETLLDNIDDIITEDHYRITFASRVRDIEGGARITKVLSLQELNDLSDEATASGFITPNESDQLAWTDVVALGRIKGSGEEVTFVAEISTTVRMDDISRAAERAEIASKAIPARRAIAVVMGRSAQGLRKAHRPGAWLIENQKATELVG